MNTRDYIGTKVVARTKAHLALGFLLAAVACDASPDAGTDGPSKEEARDQVAKGDSAIDWCEESGWYGDGTCDAFCLEPDPDCEAEGECRPTGCGGEVCADEETFTTCEAQIGQECFGLALCERQADGACGWTQTADSQACFEDASGVGQDEDAWLALMPTQCGSNPWNEDGGDEIRAILEHYGSTGVAFDQIGLLEPNEPVTVCESCLCPRGDTLLVHVTGENVTLARQAGFQDADPLAHATVQCGGNPWEALDIDAPEEAKLQRWTQDMDAFASVGFVAPVEPIAVCESCLCSRGDLAMAIPGGDDDAQTLIDNGFAAL